MFGWWRNCLRGQSRFQCPVFKGMAVLGITGLSPESSHSSLTFKVILFIKFPLYPKVLVIAYYKNSLGSILVHPTVKTMGIITCWPFWHMLQNWLCCRWKLIVLFVFFLLLRYFSLLTLKSSSNSIVHIELHVHSCLKQGYYHSANISNADSVVWGQGVCLDSGMRRGGKAWFRWLQSRSWFSGW